MDKNETESATPWWVMEEEKGNQGICSSSGMVGLVRNPSDARRIVAAVNACKDLSTEELEKGIVKELQGSLQHLYDSMDGNPYPHNVISGLPGLRTRQVLFRAKAAINEDDQTPVMTVLNK